MDFGDLMAWTRTMRSAYAAFYYSTGETERENPGMRREKEDDTGRSEIFFCLLLLALALALLNHIIAIIELASVCKNGASRA